MSPTPRDTTETNTTRRALLKAGIAATAGIVGGGLFDAADIDAAQTART